VCWLHSLCFKARPFGVTESLLTREPGQRWFTTEAPVAGRQLGHILQRHNWHNCVFCADMFVAGQNAGLNKLISVIDILRSRAHTNHRHIHAGTRARIHPYTWKRDQTHPNSKASKTNKQTNKQTNHMRSRPAPGRRSCITKETVFLRSRRRRQGVPRVLRSPFY
jgi:hypothetical protein